MSKDSIERGVHGTIERDAATQAANRLIADVQSGFARPHDGNHTAVLTDVERIDHVAADIMNPAARKNFLQQVTKKLEEAHILPVLSADFALEYQQILNGSHNGKNGNETAPLTQKNIDDALKLADANPRGQMQAILLHDLKNNWGEIQKTELHLGETPLISGNDRSLVAFAQRSWTKYEQTALMNDNGPGAAPTDKAAFQRELQALFPRLDTNGDGKVTADDLNKAMADGAFTGKDAAMLFSLRLHQTDFFGSLGDGTGFTYNDIANKFDKKFDFGKGNVQTAGDFLYGQTGRAFGELGSRTALPADDRAVFPNPNCISADAINQGMQSDCYFLSSLACVAKSNPDAIKRMITDNHDGTYSVKFPGLSRPIVVSQPGEAEFTENARISKYGTWAPLMEKAWVSYKLGAPDASINSDLPKESLQALTASHYDYLELPVVQVRGKNTRPITAEMERQVIGIVKYAIEHNQPITAGTGDGSVTNLTGLKDAHNYTIVGLDGSTIELRNPYGEYVDGGNPGPAYAVPGKPGYFKLSVSEFCRNFRQICFDQNS